MGGVGDRPKRGIAARLHGGDLVNGKVDAPTAGAEDEANAPGAGGVVVHIAKAGHKQGLAGGAEGHGNEAREALHVGIGDDGQRVKVLWMNASGNPAFEDRMRKAERRNALAAAADSFDVGPQPGAEGAYGTKTRDGKRAKHNRMEDTAGNGRNDASMSQERASECSNDPWPPYCCVILRDLTGRYLLEKRPGTARVAAGTLTCFGGKRERGETPAQCVRRELSEELAFDRAGTVGALERTVTLRASDGRLVAWFFRAEAPSGSVRALEAGYGAVWLTAEELTAAPLSPWHRAALEGERAGLREVVG